jgi:hypothetical protein
MNSSISILAMFLSSYVSSKSVYLYYKTLNKLKNVENCEPHMTFLAGFIVIVVKVSSILIGCVRPTPANRR